MCRSVCLRRRSAIDRRLCVACAHLSRSAQRYLLLPPFVLSNFRRVAYETTGDASPTNEVRKSIPIGIGAVGSAASAPNGSLPPRSANPLHHGGTMRRGGGCRKWRNGGRRRLFPQHANYSHMMTRRSMMVVAAIVLRPPRGPTPGF